MKLDRSDLELETIVRRIHANELDLQPDFQRGEVWDLRRRQRLIDTVLRNWYVPAVHIVLDTQGNEVVLDGQQRLVAIRDFFMGGFKVKGDTEPHDDAIASLDGMKYDQLPTHVRRQINRFAISIIKMTDFAPQEPNELFFRLNQSYNLTPSEKRNALHGEARDQVKHLVEDLKQLGLLQQSSIGFSNSRLAYDDVVSRVCVALAIDDLRVHINNNTVEQYYRGDPFEDRVIDSAREAGRMLQQQIEKHGSRIRFNKGTLQTWLVFCSTAVQAANPLPAALLSAFEDSRFSSKTGQGAHNLPLLHAIRFAMQVYEDRAAYRVTDVSSVILRDACLHAFAFARFGWEMNPKTEFLMHAFLDSPNQIDLLSRLAEINWGALAVQRGDIA